MESKEISPFNTVVINNTLQKLESTGCAENVNLVGIYLKLFKLNSIEKLKELENLCIAFNSIGVEKENNSADQYLATVEYSKNWNTKRHQIINFLKEAIQ